MEIDNFCSGPMIVLCSARQDALKGWKLLMGPENCVSARQSAPTSLRAIYGDPEDNLKNAVYGSQAHDDAQRDLQFFFPDSELRNMGMSFISHFSPKSHPKNLIL